MLTRRTIFAAGAAAGLAGTVAVSGRAAAQAPEQSSFDRVRTTKTLRISAIVGAEPYFKKNIADGTWSGVAIEMALDIAKPFDAKLEYVESTYSNAILDLKTGRTDLAFSLNPTAERALSIAFTHPYYSHPYTFLARAGLQAKTWSDINKPEVRVSASLGTLPDVLVKRYAPKATLMQTKTIDEGVMAVQTGRSDLIITAALQALSIKAKNKQFTSITVPTGPRIALPTCLGVRQEMDPRWVNYLNAWIDYNRASGLIMEWIKAELAKGGISPDEIPEDA